MSPREGEKLTLSVRAVFHTPPAGGPGVQAGQTSACFSLSETDSFAVGATDLAYDEVFLPVLESMC